MIFTHMGLALDGPEEGRIISHTQPEINLAVLSDNGNDEFGRCLDVETVTYVFEALSKCGFRGVWRVKQ